MADQFHPASPLFLREPEIRRGIELLYFGYSHMTRAADQRLESQGLGRAHHRALYFIARSPDLRSEEHTSELQSLMRISYAVFCLKKKKKTQHITNQLVKTHI